MSQEKITFITDGHLKKEAAEVSREMGITTSAALNLFLRAFVGTRSIPFDVKADYESAEEKAEISRILAERTAIANDPKTMWMTQEDAKKALGL